MKRKIEPSESLQMMDVGPTVMVGVRDEGHKRLNLFAVAWIIPCSIKPPLVVMSVNPKNFSHELIQNTREFTVNIPGVPLLDKLHFCGTRSGRDSDKVEKLSLTPGKG
jgi:flavin reductase (DIM6/NTAB) family NADH-FMN oxidoreductase RutF